MISSQFDAVIPMLCVALAGLVVLLAEAFRAKGEQMPIGGLAIIGLVGAGVASVLLWDRNADQLRRRHRRQLRAVREPGARRRRHPDRGVLVADHRARRPAGGRVLRAACCSRSSA